MEKFWRVNENGCRQLTIVFYARSLELLRMSRLDYSVSNNHSEQDAMWEREDYLREVYPAFYEE